MTEREKLMKEIYENGNAWSRSKGSTPNPEEYDELHEDVKVFLGFFADFILNDRRRILEPSIKLYEIGRLDGEYYIADKAILETLKLSGLLEEK